MVCEERSDGKMKKRNQGFILIMVLLLLTILSLSAFVAVEQSQFSYKANHTRLAKLKARQISEDGRLMAINKLTTLLKENKLDTNTNGLKIFTSFSQDASRAEVYLKELPVQVLKTGMSLNQNMAYSGLGMGLGNHGSFSTRYELSAKGVVKNKGRDVIFWTASDYQFVP